MLGRPQFERNRLFRLVSPRVRLLVLLQELLTRMRLILNFCNREIPVGDVPADMMIAVR